MLLSSSLLFILILTFTQLSLKISTWKKKYIYIEYQLYTGWRWGCNIQGEDEGLQQDYVWNTSGQPSHDKSAITLEEGVPQDELIICKNSNFHLIKYLCLYSSHNSSKNSAHLSETITL